MASKSIREEIVEHVLAGTDRLILSSEGVWFRETRAISILGDMDDQIMQLYAGRPLWLPSFYKGWSVFQKNINGTKLTLLVNRLTALPIKTYWRTVLGADKSVSLVPLFENAADAVLTEYQWAPPKNTALFYLYNVGTNESFLLLLKPVSGTTMGFFRVPLPNLYDNGRICTGSVAITTTDMIDKAQEYLTSVRSSIWNPDLMCDYVQRLSAGMFSFDANGKQIPVTDATIGNLARVANATFDELIIGGHINDLV